jgi:C-terminal processing protease CtpA/Prc
VLNRFRILIDYPSARLWLRPSGRAPDPSASTTRVGVSIAFGDDGCPVVRAVTDTNAKDTLASLEVGDVLVGIDGKNACSMWHHEIQAALAGKAGEVKRLGIRRNGQAMEVAATVGELLPM